MKKTGLYGVGLLVAAVSLTVSCGGDDGDNNGGTGGSSTGGSSAGTSTSGSTSGGSSTSGSSSGGSSNGGSSNGGSSSGGSNNNQGGEDDPGPGPQGGDGPGPGGELPACGAGQTDGEDCEQGDDPCEPAEGGVCFCGGGGNPEWNCINFGGEGGGPGGGFGNADCGDNPMSDDDCDGFGQCEGSETCACFQGTVICGQM